ncbi:putative trace amine-associated receptor 3 [Gigantopelta aegis]|uniref:putative trace amine-associated receptor 3 n=1 Tax=Gigantopelta aegis TaxID=1735272 RepID=UPI001B88C094|nr:putative trace amine-associated receptor 3 [Gigantopelta aegis]
MASGINSTNGSSLNISDSPRPLSTVIMIYIEIVLIPIIVGGNGLIICAVCRFKTLQHPSNVMVVFLAIGDFLMGAVYIPTKLLASPANFSKIPCLINVFNSYVCISLAITFLSMLSVERFYAVQFPFHYHTRMSIKTSVTLCGVIFAGVVILMLPILSGIDTWAYGKYCFNTNVLPNYYIWTCLSIMGSFLIAGFLSFIRVVFAEVQIRKRNNEQRSQTAFRQQDSIRSTLMIMVYSFSMMCWMPQLVYVFWSAFKPAYSNVYALRAVSIVGLCSSGINFFIYGIKNSRFRNSFKKLFGCKVSTVGPPPDTVIMET